MREGWAEARIDELGNGKRPVLKAGPFGSSVTKATYQASGYKVYGQQEVVAKDLNAEAYFVSEETFRRHKGCKVVPGDLLMTMMGTIGRVYRVPESAPEGIINPRLVRIAFDPSRLLPDFAEAVLEQPPLQRLLDRRSHGGTMQGLNLEAIASIRLPLPPLPEQRKIAEILRTWDEALEKLTALRAAKQQRYKALARRFFDPCHPTFEGRPNAWREFELGDVFIERSQPGEDNDRLLSITMGGGVIDREDVGRKDTSTADKSKYKLILPGDIGYNTMRMWQGVAGLSGLRGIISPAYTVVTPVADHILDRYAAHLFKSRRMVFDFERYSQGLTSDTWQLKFAAFSKINVFLPPVEDQEKEANLLDFLIAEGAVIGKQIDALTQQKRGLMQKLLTGEWPVRPEGAVD